MTGRREETGKGRDRERGNVRVFSQNAEFIILKALVFTSAHFLSYSTIPFLLHLS